MRREQQRRMDDYSAYHVPEKTRAQQQAAARCVRCDGAVNPWERPADARVAALCDGCQRATITR